ncbi:MAG: ACP S-malonyltransferase [Caldilineaceae bacterium]
MSEYRYSDETFPLALIFPGQGSQHVGMAQELAAQFPAARETLQEADEILGFALSQLCADGPAETLTATINAQPALLTGSIAALRVLQHEMGLMPRPQFFAGHSLGEYSALVAANSLSFADGLRLVRERGRLMTEAGALTPGRMAAVLGLDEDVVAQACADASASSGGLVQIANDNCPGQIVISGDVAGIEAAMATLQAAGARKVVPLDVSIASHSPLMAPVAGQLRAAIESTAIQPPIAPLLANTSAEAVTEPAAIVDELAAQLTGSVKWTASMQRAVDAGVTVFAEIGPGNVLTGLIKRIARSAERINVADVAGVGAFREGVVRKS